jgi:hypothetical protein
LVACGPNGCLCTLKDDTESQSNIEESQREKRGCGEFGEHLLSSVKLKFHSSTACLACGPNGCFCTLKENENEGADSESQREKRGCGEFFEN